MAHNARSENLNDKPITRKWMEKHPAAAIRFEHVLNKLRHHYTGDNQGYIDKQQYRFNDKSTGGYIVVVAQVHRVLVILEPRMPNRKEFEIHPATFDINVQNLLINLAACKPRNFDWSRQPFPKLASKPTSGNKLPLKDESDVLVITTANRMEQRRIHNKMTNRLREVFGDKYDVTEGEGECMYDAIISNYHGTHDLLIEAKSSIEVPHVRMAIGQLLDYRWRRKQSTKRDAHLAVLLPANPSKQVTNLLESLDIQIMWLENDRFCSENSKLKQFLSANQS